MRLKTPLATHLLSARVKAVCRRFERWRKTRTHRSPIPEALWGAAVTVARECGLHRTAQTLRLNYDALKERGEAAGRQSPRGQETKPTFVELDSPAPSPFPECTV